VTERGDCLRKLERAGVIAALAWVARTAYTRVGQDYDPAAGHGRTVSGVLGYTYFQDLQDRAFSLGAFRVPAAEIVAGRSGQDILREGISPEAFTTMPGIPSGTVRRADFNTSPGWAVEDVRWLLQSYPYGKIDDVPWAQKSPSKQRIANQSYIDQPAVLDGWADLGLDESAAALDTFEGVTLVLAHAFNGATGEYELYLGRPRMKRGRGDSAWHWRERIARGGGSGGGIPIPDAPALPGNPPTQNVADAPVRLRDNVRQVNKED